MKEPMTKTSGTKMKRHTIHFEVNVPSEYSAGIRGFSDSITVIIGSGDPGGEPEEFAKEMRKFLENWYDGGKITIIDS